MTTPYIKQIVEKQDDGTLAAPIRVGASFEDIIDTREDSEIQYSLAQFFDNYKNYMNNTTFVHKGKTQPTNSHCGIWIDTSTVQN